jgi:lipopolysaccharide export system ATP-binding protein
MQPPLLDAGPGTSDRGAGETGTDNGGTQRVLAARGLVKRYRRRTVVNGVSISVSSGEIVGLLGPNGAGKTTSFYMIVGLVGADTGTITLDGRDITRLPMHARARLGVGYLPQEASVFRKLSVADNIMAILEVRDDLNGRDRGVELERLLRELHIGHVRDGLGMSLSGGERRRTEIARALAANPRFILLDEPFAGVDPIAVLDIQQIVRHLTTRGIGVLITDHNVRETLGICHRAYILAEGEVIAEGAPSALLENETVRRVYLGEQFRL